MLIIRYSQNQKNKLAAVTDNQDIYALPQQDFISLTADAKKSKQSTLIFVQQLIASQQPLSIKLEELQLLTPIVAPEIWAAGVTYLRSREARNYETSKEEQSDKTFYDKVYDAVRPEIFLKSSPLRTVGPNEELFLRSDSNWQVPEPELGLVLDHDGQLLGFTVGNDMSCRDIEGENPLYLPQAKMWRKSCAIGPAIRLVETVQDPYSLDITCSIYRNNQLAFKDTISTGKLKRKLEELISFLVRDNDIYDGTILLTGTGIVPPNDFTLLSGDRVDIEITGIGTLSNPIH